MLPFLILLGSGLCGYALAPVYSWPAATLGLLVVSWARHYVLIRRGLEAGLDDSVRDVLVRSSLHALVATGACYWSGVAVRAMSLW
jgi:hypothetical protein